MSSPWQVLGILPGADASQIHAAYITLVKKNHPDRFTDPEEKAAAQERLIDINLAYEKAMRLAQPKPEKKPVNDFTRPMPLNDSVKLAMKMLSQERPEAALRHLARAESRDDTWYFVRGRALMMSEKYPEAVKSFREAVRRSPDNMEYRRHALESELAERRSHTLQEKVKRVFRFGKNKTNK